MLSESLSGSDEQHKKDSINQHRFEFAEQFKRTFESKHGRPFDRLKDSAAMRAAYDEEHRGRKAITPKDFQNAYQWARKVGLIDKGDG